MAAINFFVLTQLQDSLIILLNLVVNLITIDLIGKILIERALIEKDLIYVRIVS